MAGTDREPAVPARPAPALRQPRTGSCYRHGQRQYELWPPNDQSNTDTSLGLKAGIGATWFVTQNMGVFGEYRFTHFSPEFEFQNTFPGNTKLKVHTDINTNHLLIGVSFRF